MCSAPNTIGSYKVARELAVGLLGPVYLGTYENAYWALRVIDESMVRQGKTIGALIGDVVHDSLVRYKELGADNSVGGFLSTDYVEAKPIGRDGLAGLPSKDRISFVQQLLDGIGYLHKRGLVHGNIKRTNVLLRKRGENRNGLLIDAGLIYVPNPNNASKLLHRAYPTMAPELIQAYAGGDRKAIDEALTPAADVYAAGMLVAEVFSGRQFFTDARSIDDLLRMKRDTTITMTGCNDPHRHIDLSLLDHAIQAAIADSPANRPTIAGFIESLGKVVPQAEAAEAS